MLRQNTLRHPARRAVSRVRHAISTTTIPTTSRNPTPATTTTSTTTRHPPSGNDRTLSLLESQRLRRPVSPHLSIYRPQHTWFNPSILGRITGSLLSGGLYLFFAAYACAPLLGWDLSSQNVVAAAAALPAAATVGAKSLLGFAGSFHCANGVRHLVWDCGKQLNNVAVRRSGWVVVGVSVCGAVAGAMW